MKLILGNRLNCRSAFLPEQLPRFICRLRRIIRLVFITAVFLPHLTSPVSAAVSAFLAEDQGGVLYRYEYRALLDSYALKIIGRPNGLFEDFAGKTPRMLQYNKNSENIYFDYTELLNRKATAVIKGQKFDLDSHAQSASAAKAEPPLQVIVVTLQGGNLVKMPVGGTQPQGQVPPPQVSTGASGPVQPVSAGSEDRTGGPSLPGEVGAPLTGVTISATPLLAASSITESKAQAWAAGKNAHRRFIDIAPLYWEYGRQTGICPEALYAQAALETNFGHYTGQVPAGYNNWAGIKTADAAGDRPEDHQQFATPEDGVRAHFNHMSAYIGLKPVGTPHDRYWVVVRLPWAGTIRLVEELSGKWAPSPTYHVRIVQMIGEMRM